MAVHQLPVAVAAYCGTRTDHDCCVRAHCQIGRVAPRVGRAQANVSPMPDMRGCENGFRCSCNGLKFDHSHWAAMSRRVHVDNQDVCQAFSAGSSELKLVGTGNGVTRLVVWADTDDQTRPTKMRAFEIHVEEAVASSGQAVSLKLALKSCMTSLQKMFPCLSSAIAFDRTAVSCCTVFVTVNSRQPRLFELCARTCLIPVRDELRGSTVISMSNPSNQLSPTVHPTGGIELPQR